MATTNDEETGVSARETQPPPYQPDYGTTDNVPPAYEETNPLDPPPSYDSIYGKVKAAKVESSGFMDFMKKFLVILVGSIGCTICVGLVLAIPIAMIVIGAIYKDDCPRERMIPIYLMVAGCFGVLKNLSNMVQRCLNKKKEQDDENAKTNPFDSIVSCFLLAWFIAGGGIYSDNYGNVWIYSIHGDFDTTGTADGNPRFCDPTLYYFAFWITTATYILMATTCCCIICAGTAVGIASV